MSASINMMTAVNASDQVNTTETKTIEETRSPDENLQVIADMETYQTGFMLFFTVVIICCFTYKFFKQFF